MNSSKPNPMKLMIFSKLNLLPVRYFFDEFEEENAVNPPGIRGIQRSYYQRQLHIMHR
jgi:hypothetical protein